MKFTDQELLLMRRAMVLLSCVVEGRESSLCMDLAQRLASEYRVNQMFREDEQAEELNKAEMPGAGGR